MKTKHEFKIKHAVNLKCLWQHPRVTHGTSLRLGSEHTAPALCLGLLSPTQCPQHLSSDLRLLYAWLVEYNVQSCLALIETWCFNYGKQQHLIFSYCCSSACKHYISLSLVYIVFKCLILKLPIWASQRAFKPNTQVAEAEADRYLWVLSSRLAWSTQWVPS